MDNEKPVQSRRISWYALSSPLIAVLGPVGLLFLCAWTHADGFAGIVFIGIAAVFSGSLGVGELRRDSSIRRSGWFFALTGMLLGGAFLYLAVSSQIRYEFGYGHDKCLNNLKQIAAAVEIYQDDHDGMLPPPENWNHVVLSGIQVMSRTGPSAPGGFDDRLRCCRRREYRKPGLPTYAMNANVVGVNLTDMANPAEVPAIFESVPGRNLVGGPELLPAPARHRGYHDVLFCDGHVAMHTEDEIRRMPWQPKMKGKAK